jgi:hypothetical protein
VSATPTAHAAMPGPTWGITSSPPPADELRWLWQGDAACDSLVSMLAGHPEQQGAAVHSGNGSSGQSGPLMQLQPEPLPLDLALGAGRPHATLHLQAPFSEQVGKPSGEGGQGRTHLRACMRACISYVRAMKRSCAHAGIITHHASHITHASPLPFLVACQPPNHQPAQLALTAFYEGVLSCFS